MLASTCLYSLYAWFGNFSQPAALEGEASVVVAARVYGWMSCVAMVLPYGCSIVMMGVTSGGCYLTVVVIYMVNIRAVKLLIFSRVNRSDYFLHFA